MLKDKFTVCYKKKWFTGKTPLEAVFECIWANPRAKFSKGLFVWHSCVKYRENEIEWLYFQYIIGERPAKFFTKRKIYEIRCRDKLK